jgi:methyl-accepting chemotaxis protein
MRPLRRVIGVLLIPLAAVSAVVSILLVIQVWRLKEPATERLTTAVDSFAATLATADQTLTTAETALDTASATLITLSFSLDSLARTIENNQPLIDSLRNLVQDTLPDMVYSMQNSFNTAQESSRIIDTVLRAVTSIPFFPGEPYNPPVPLHESLAAVSESLDSLPQDFQTMENSLASTGGNLVYFNTQVDRVKENITEINESLDATRQVIVQYRAIVGPARTTLENLQEGLPQFITITVWVITFVFIWLAIFQVYLMVQGIHMMQDRPADVQVYYREPEQIEATVVTIEEPE